MVGAGQWFPLNRHEGFPYPGSIQAPVFKVEFVKAEVVAQFVEEGDADFFAVDSFVAVGEVPKVFEEKDDLRWNGETFAVGKSLADEEAEGVGFDVVGEEVVVGDRFESDGQAVGAGLEVRREGAEGGVDFRFGDAFEINPVHSNEGAASHAGRNGDRRKGQGLARFLEGAEGRGAVAEKTSEVGEAGESRGAEMMLDALDVEALHVGGEAEKGKEAFEGGMAGLDAAGDFAAFISEDQTAVFDVVEVAEFPKFLNHAGDGGLLDVEGRGDVHDPGIAFFLDEFVDALEIIFRALAGRGWHGFLVSRDKTRSAEPTQA